MQNCPKAKHYIIVLTICLMQILNIHASKAEETLYIASIDWCPQLCNQNEPKAGYIHDIVLKAFEGSKYKLDLQILPWTRAISDTRRGKTIAILAPAKAEAPDLKYPNLPVGTQRMCFFTRADNKWTYKDESSLAGLKIGVARDTSLEELNDYLLANRDQFEFLTYSEQYIYSSLRKTYEKRIDTFLFTLNSTMHEMKKITWSDKFRSAGCVNEAKVFMAFTPDKSQKEKVQTLMSFLDDRIENLILNKKLDEIFQAYDIEDRISQFVSTNPEKVKSENIYSQ